MDPDNGMGIVSATDAGAPHLRKRIWIMADAAGIQDDPQHEGHVRYGQRGWDALDVGQEAARQTDGKADNNEPCGCRADVADAAGSRCDGRAGQEQPLCGRAPLSARSGGRREVPVTRDPRPPCAGSGNESEGALALAGNDHPEVPDAASDGLARRGHSWDGRDGLANDGADVPDAEIPRLEGTEPAGNLCAGGCASEHGPGRRQADWWDSEPDVGLLGHGLATSLGLHGADAAGDVGRVARGVHKRAARLRCLGEGQVPMTMAIAWRMLTEMAKE